MRMPFTDVIVVLVVMTCLLEELVEEGVMKNVIPYEVGSFAPSVHRRKSR